MNADPINPDFCPAFRDALQTYLDREIDSLPAECELHRTACANCRQDYAAAMLLRALSQSPMAAPEGMTDRLVAAVLADTTTTSRRRVIAATRTAALAASLLLVIGLVIRLGESSKSPEVAPRVEPVTAAKDQTPAAISVDENISKAGDAIAALVRRSASDTIEPTIKLIPENPTLGFPDVPDPMAPAAQSLAEIRQGASSGFEPLGRTARRAFNLFLRDVSVQGDNKPGS